MERYLNLLKTEIRPAIGCTEPIAIAFGTFKLKEFFHLEVENIEKIELHLSKNIIKNALDVGIPGTSYTGILIASSLGLFAKNNLDELKILENMNKDEINEAEKFVKENKVKFYFKENSPKLYIEINIHIKEDRFTLVIENSHTSIAKIMKNSEVLYINESFNDKEHNHGIETFIKEIFEFTHSVSLEKIEFLSEIINLNKLIAIEGLNKNYGLRVGKTLKESIDKKFVSNDIKNYAIFLTAAASDARMGGCLLPVMTNSGSGNQGITASLPVIAVAEKLELSNENLLRALALSSLITIHIKSKLGKLSALCGVTVSAIGSGAGIIYLMDGKFENIESFVKNMIGNITGMICDGAKGTCALKIATVVDASFNSLFLALHGSITTKNVGIIDDNIENSIDNLINLGSVGMEETDKMIFDIMIKKNRNSY